MWFRHVVGPAAYGEKAEMRERESYQGPSIPINNDKLDMVDQEANVLLNLHEMALTLPRSSPHSPFSGMQVFI